MTSEGDSINVGDISNSVVAAGAGSSVTVIQQVVQRVGGVATQYDAAVKNFIDHHIGSTDTPEPFGGRQPDLTAYSRWLDDSTAPSYALLTAPAGRGKSTVLAYWVLQLEHRNDVKIVFMPISERFQTNTESVVFEALYARLAYLHADQPVQASSADQYRGAFQDYLNRPLPDGRRLLVVIDGLDEAVGWSVNAGLFPDRPPAHLKILVAARDMAGDLDWATRLGWHVPSRATWFGLRPLSRSDLEEVLQRLGNPLAGQHASVEFLDRLYELTDQGDPLMIRLYVDALREDRGAAPELRPDDLKHLTPGLKPFFDVWFDRQEKRWATEHNSVNIAAVHALISARASAYGPLTADDLVSLAPGEFSGSHDARRAAKALGRFLTGNGARGNGYTFTHPRMTQYFREQLTDQEIRVWQKRFIEYGATTLAELKSDAGNPVTVSEYIVRHYRLHLQSQSDPPESLSALMCQGWLLAWRQLEGTDTGFLNDVQAAMDQAATAGAASLGQVFRGALCSSSVVSNGDRIRPELIKLALSSGALHPRVALSMARSKPTSLDRVQSLVAVANEISAETSSILREALVAAREIEDDGDRAQALSAVAAWLPEYEAKHVLSEALALAREISADIVQATVLEVIAKPLARVARDLVIEILDLARSIQTVSYRARALCAVAEQMPVEEARALLREALAALRSSGEMDRIRVMCQLARSLSGDEARAMFGEAMALAHQIDHEESRVDGLCEVAKCIGPEAQDLLGEVLENVLKLRSAENGARALSAIAGRLSEQDAIPLMRIALEWVREVRNESKRAVVLRQVTKYIPSSAQGLIDEAMSLAGNIADESYRSFALMELARRFPPEVAKDLLMQAVALALRIRDEMDRAVILGAAASRLPATEANQLLATAFGLVGKIQSDWVRGNALIALLDELPLVDDAFLERALLIARSIEENIHRAETLIGVARRLSKDKAIQVREEAIALVRGIPDEYERMLALQNIRERLPLNEGREIAIEELSFSWHWTEGPRVEALCALAKWLPSEEALSVLSNALTVAYGIGDDGIRARALSVVARSLGTNDARLLVIDSLEYARKVADPRERALALSSVWVDLLSQDEAMQVASEALAAVENIQSEGSRASALCEVVNHLALTTTDLVTQSLAIARTIEVPSYRFEALSAVVKKLDSQTAASEWSDLLALDQSLDDTARLEYFSDLADHWAVFAEGVQRDELALLLRLFNPAPRVVRVTLLRALGKFMPVIDRLGGQAVLRELAAAIQETAEWWP